VFLPLRETAAIVPDLLWWEAIEDVCDLVRILVCSAATLAKSAVRFEGDDFVCSCVNQRTCLVVPISD
jgi:hypothetical protein